MANGRLPAADAPDLFTLAGPGTPLGETAGRPDYSYWGSTWRLFLQSRATRTLLILLSVLLLLACLQPLLPGQRSPLEIHNDPLTGLQLCNLPPSSAFWLGTNAIGQDLWARIWSGTRTSLLIALAVGAGEMILGVTFGAAWGYLRRLEQVLTETYNLLSNLPTTLLLMLLAYLLKPGFQAMVLALAATGWLGMARIVRNQILVIRDRPFNIASRCLGTPARRIIRRNLMPHLVSVILLQTALSIPATIGWEVFLTYIGIGLPESTPSLGNLLNHGRMVMMAPDLRYQLWFPAGLLVFITVSIFLLGNGFADAADPRNHF